MLLARLIKFATDHNNLKVLGRWNIDYCNKKMDQKIDLANEDNCGPCGQYALSKHNQGIQAIQDIDHETSNSIGVKTIDINDINDVNHEDNVKNKN